MGGVSVQEGEAGAPRTRERGLLGFLRRHPVLLLIMLSPGIPEYISGSSPISALVTNPPQFFLQLVLNLGLYGPGVLLVREARVRWRKGWPTVVLLGSAYAIVEEGIALSTMFNPTSSVVVSSGLGVYGHWLGVSWIWVEGIILVHAVYSISIPILLLDLAVPDARDRPFLGSGKLTAAIAILCVDVLALFALVYFGQRFYMGDAVLFGALIAVFALVYLARRAPVHWGARETQSPPFGLVPTAILGFFGYVGVLLIEGATRNTAAVLTFVLVAVFEGGYLWLVFHSLSFPGNERHLLAFSLGAVIPLIPFGLISEFPIEIVLLADLAILLFYGQLFRMYPSKSSAVQSPTAVGGQRAAGSA